MGNILLRCFRGDSDDDHYLHQYRYSDYRPPPRQYSENSVAHGTVQATSGLAALVNDLLIFEITSQVPEELSAHVDASEKAQANWYRQLLEAWKEETPAPKTRLAAATLVARTLRRHREEDIQGILDYYRLPPPQPLSPWKAVAQSAKPLSPPTIGLQARESSPERPIGVRFKLDTLPVEANGVTDGDGITVYVDAVADGVPVEVMDLVIRRAGARAEKDFRRAKELYISIKKAGYRVIDHPNGQVNILQKHRIRLRGIDAPEGPQPFGKEAKEGLTALTKGKSLTIHVYNTDRYGRLVGDVYCKPSGMFVQVQEHESFGLNNLHQLSSWLVPSHCLQKRMLRSGLAMHYAAFDKRPEFAKWQREAQAARRGLWASPNPEKPWEWRKRNKGWMKEQRRASSTT